MSSRGSRSPVYIGTSDRDRSRGAGVTSFGVDYDGKGEWAGVRRGARNFNNRRRNSSGSSAWSHGGGGPTVAGVGRDGWSVRKRNYTDCVPGAGRCECVRGARIITKYRELIKHIVGARRLDNRYKLPPRAKQLTGETRADSTRRGTVASSSSETQPVAVEFDSRARGGRVRFRRLAIFILPHRSD